jgi:hypothetical protein
MRYSLPAILLVLVWPAIAADSMDAEIDFLLDFVEHSGCTFIRNGKEHEPAAARGHLELKRKRGKRYYDSTEEFIERIASSSSWSGKPYLIRCGEEQAKPIKNWYISALSEYRTREAQPTN